MGPETTSPLLREVTFQGPSWPLLPAVDGEVPRVDLAMCQLTAFAVAAAPLPAVWWISTSLAHIATALFSLFSLEPITEAEPLL